MTALAGPHAYTRLSDRVAVLHGLRVIGAAAAVATAASRHGPVAAFAAIALGYVAATTSIELLRRLLRARAAVLVSTMLLIDGALLSAAVAYTGGYESPLVLVAITHVLAVTLLASYRTGLKLALWYALLLFVGYAAARAGMIAGAPRGRDWESALSAMGFLVVASVAGVCSSLNERALREGRANLHSLVELAEELERTRDGDELTRQLARHVAEVGFVRVMVARRHDDRWVGWIWQSGHTDRIDIEGPDLALAPDRDAQLIATPTDPVITALLPDAQNVVVVPLAAGGDALGVVVAEWRRGRRARVPTATLDSVGQAAAHGSLALHNALLVARLAEQATHDHLTGLANRKLFDEILEREVKRWERGGAPVSLMTVDVDNFKSVNDTFGHATGDEVLRTVASVLAARCRQVDVVARLGGDEFAVILPDCSGADALGAAERLRTDFRAKQPSGPVVRISAGVACVPENAPNRIELLAAADDALYEAKQRGRDCVVQSRRDALADPAGVA